MPNGTRDLGCQSALSGVPFFGQAFGTLIGAIWPDFYSVCSFSRMKDPVSRLERRRQGVSRQVRLNAGGNNFFENFGDEVEVGNWTKVVEIISG